MAASRSLLPALAILAGVLAPLGAPPCAAGPRTPAEQAVLDAESAPLDAAKVKAAHAAVLEALNSNPPTVLSRELAARIAIVESKGKLGKERRTLLTDALKRLDEASRFDFRDPEPYKVRLAVLRELGIQEDEYVEALRCVAIRMPADPLARQGYFAATGKVAPLRVGDPMPDVFWLDADGQQVRSPSLWAKGPVVIELYRSAVWCPYCEAQIVGMDKKLDEFAEEGIEVVACSPDTPETLKDIRTNGLKGRKPFRLRLLADPKGATADLLGVLNPETVKAGTPADAYGLPFPTTFVVDGNGIIRFVKTHGDHRERVKPDEMLSIANRIRNEKTPQK